MTSPQASKITSGGHVIWLTPATGAEHVISVRQQVVKAQWTWPACQQPITDGEFRHGRAAVGQSVTHYRSRVRGQRSRVRGHGSEVTHGQHWSAGARRTAVATSPGVKVFFARERCRGGIEASRSELNGRAEVSIHCLTLPLLSRSPIKMTTPMRSFCASQILSKRGTLNSRHIWQVRSRKSFAGVFKISQLSSES